jgi:hypothetical protein
MDDTQPAERFGSASTACCILSLIWFPPRMHPRVPPIRACGEGMVSPEVLYESSSRPFRRDARRLAPVFAHHV